jgi:hypothetical protein
MSRLAKFFVVSLVLGIFLLSYSLDLGAAWQQPFPAGEASRLRIRFQEADGVDASFSLPVGLVAVILASAPEGACLEMNGVSMTKAELWRRLREANSRSPLEFQDGGDRVQIWLE